MCFYFSIIRLVSFTFHSSVYCTFLYPCSRSFFITLTCVKLIITFFFMYFYLCLLSSFTFHPCFFHSFFILAFIHFSFITFIYLSLTYIHLFPSPSPHLPFTLISLSHHPQLFFTFPSSSTPFTFTSPSLHLHHLPIIFNSPSPSHHPQFPFPSPSPHLPLCSGECGGAG